jgi:hypothetical protein
VRFLVDELVDTLDFLAVMSEGSAIIFMHKTIELVVLFIPFGFGRSSFLCCLNCGQFILSFFLFSKVLSVTSDLNLQIVVDSGHFFTIAKVPFCTIILVNLTIKWIELPFPFSCFMSFLLFFRSFLCCCFLSSL